MSIMITSPDILANVRTTRTTGNRTTVGIVRGLVLTQNTVL